MYEFNISVLEKKKTNRNIANNSHRSLKSINVIFTNIGYYVVFYTILKKLFLQVIRCIRYMT